MLVGLVAAITGADRLHPAWRETGSSAALGNLSTVDEHDYTDLRRKPNH